MSKRINVNPDHYKVAGRERPGTTISRAPSQPSNMDEARARERWATKQREKAPGARGSRKRPTK